MTFRELEHRLLSLLNQKVKAGEISQRQLAHLTGFTQPHIHNVLKQARGLKTELADAVLECLELSVDDLLEGRKSSLHERVCLWRGPLGPHNSFPSRVEESVHLLFPVSFLSRFDRPILVRLALDEDVMSPLIEPGDLVLLDRAEAPRRRPVVDCIYVLCIGGHGRVCRCQRAGGALVLLAENSRCSSRLPGYVTLDKHDILDIVRGRVVWSCREFAQQ